MQLLMNTHTPPCLCAGVDLLDHLDTQEACLTADSTRNRHAPPPINLLDYAGAISTPYKRVRVNKQQKKKALPPIPVCWSQSSRPPERP